MRLWAQITVAVVLNLLAIGALLAAMIMQQTRSGPESFLFAPARERVRELGRQVEEEFPVMSAPERTAWLASKQATLGVTLAVFDDTGRQVAGPSLEVPPGVEREIRRGRRRDADSPDRPRSKRGGRNDPPMFLVREADNWIGYHFPLTLEPGRPPVRHTLTAMAQSLLAAPFFFDWTPWLLGICLALLVTIVCWAPLIRRFSRSLSALQTASTEIAQGRFDIQIPVTGKDEFADLAASVRRMAAQLSQLVNGQRRFLADVAHELCAPLSRIQLSMGILEQNAAPSDKIAVERLERDVAHMSALVGDLLSFTKGNVRQPDLVPLRLAEIVNQVIAQECPAEVTVSSSVANDVMVVADSDYLHRAIGNVVRNAVRYAGDHGPILIWAHKAGTKVHLAVQDGGPGLPEADLEAIFNPFYRPDSARTPGTGGAGLGLAIVKSCMEACDGSVWCRNRQPLGLEVIMELKQAQAWK